MRIMQFALFIMQPVQKQLTKAPVVCILEK